MPEGTFGEKLKKQRYIKGLTAEELGKLCNRSKYVIYSYEADKVRPHHTIVAKICKALNVSVKYFNDDYYSFVLSKNYTSFLKKWREKNTRKYYDIEKILGVSYNTYKSWENGNRMTRRLFEKVKNKLFYGNTHKLRV